MNNDCSDDSDDSEEYSERTKLGEKVDKQAMVHEGITTRIMVPLQTLLKNEKEGCSVFHGFCSAKGIWENKRLKLENLFSIQKLEIFGDGQELEQGESGGVGKKFRSWFRIVS